MDRKEEIRKVIRENSKYLLSHHRPRDYYRCYSFSFFSKNLNLCARCTGIYPGILAGLIQTLYLNTSMPLYILALTGIPTLIEKYLTGIQGYRGYNTLRTLTGVLLGSGYINGLYILVQNPFQIEVIAIGVFYVAAASYLIIRQRQKDKAPN